MGICADNQNPTYETGIILDDGTFYPLRFARDAYRAKRNALDLELKSGIRGIYWIRRIYPNGIVGIEEPAFLCQ